MDWNSAIISGFRAGIVAIGRDGVVTYINPIGARILRDSPLAVGDNIKDKAGENSFFWMLGEAISLDYLSPRVETYLADRDGQPIRIGFTLAELKDGGDKVGICAFFKDLRHVEIAEENENLKQRLFLLERVGAGLAGEITTPVVNLGAVSKMLRAQAAQEKITLPALPMLDEEILRLENVLRECQGFIHPVKLSLEDVPVDTLVAEIVATLAAIHTEMRFKVNKPAAANLTAAADAGLLGKALSLIMVHAVDSCGCKGALDVTLSLSRHFVDVVRLDREVRSLLPGHSGTEEEFLRIAIRNDGPRIPRDVRDRVFIPFDTARKPGSGTGLSVAQKIVSAHGGIVEIKDAAAKGVEYRIMIPVRQQAAPA